MAKRPRYKIETGDGKYAEWSLKGVREWWIYVV